jgi:hypothetical protein
LSPRPEGIVFPHFSIYAIKIREYLSFIVPRPETKNPRFTLRRPWLRAALLAACCVVPSLAHAQLFVVQSDYIGQFTYTGSTVHLTFVGVSEPGGIAAVGNIVFVTNFSNESIDEYTGAGVLVHANLVSGLSTPSQLVVSGSDLFVVNNGGTNIGEYTTSGATVNANLITGLNEPTAIAISGSDLFISNFGNGTISEYTTSGALVNADLISGIADPYSIAVSGSDLFISENTTTIGEYTTSGATVNTSFITGLSNPWSTVVHGSDLYVANYVGGHIGEYTTSGGVINTHLITSFFDPIGIAIPEPAAWPVLAALGATAVAVLRRRRNASVL